MLLVALQNQFLPLNHMLQFKSSFILTSWDEFELLWAILWLLYPWVVKGGTLSLYHELQLSFTHNIIKVLKVKHTNHDAFFKFW